jgi:hypothetical protein
MYKTPYTAKIVTVFDHSQSFGYCADGVVTAYNGEQGLRSYGEADPVVYTCGLTGRKNPLFAFAQSGRKPFSINGQYVGEGGIYLNYDGHPGFDFQTIDQDPSGKIPVLAAAAGTVVCTRVPSDCKDTKPVQYCTEGPGEIKIDHGNGYFSIYLHLSLSQVSANQPVVAGQQIGISGDTGVCGVPHLHFEVRNGTAGSTCPKQSCVPVDPYGWTGTGTDPYLPRAVNVSLWQQSSRDVHERPLRGDPVEEVGVGRDNEGVDTDLTKASPATKRAPEAPAGRLYTRDE